MAVVFPKKHWSLIAVLEDRVLARLGLGIRALG